MKVWLLILPPLVCGLSVADDPESAAGRPAGEARYSLSLTDEGSFAAGLSVPGPDVGNLLLIEPSFGYRYGERWRFSGSLAGLAETQDETYEQLRVRETYVAFTAGDLDLTVGKRILRWGVGYAFTATGVLDPPRVATDPTDRLNLNEGREMGEADWVAGKQEFTAVWASAGLVDKQPGAHDTAAFRYGVMAGGFDTSVVVAHDCGGTTLAGVNFTRVLGDAVEIHGELAWRQQAAVLLGTKYTLRSGWQAIAEFYTPPNTEYYRPAGMPAWVGRQHYGFLRIGKTRLRELPGWKEWDVTASLVANLSDGSRIGVFDVVRRIKNCFGAYLHAQTPGGKARQSEFGAIPYSALVSIGVTFHM
jgi:hypothetical protein